MIKTVIIEMRKKIKLFSCSLVAVFLLFSVLSVIGLNIPVVPMQLSYAQVKTGTVKSNKVEVPVVYKGLITVVSEFRLKDPFYVSFILVNESEHASVEIEVPIKNSKKPTGFTFEVPDLKALYSLELKIHSVGNPAVAQALMGSQYLGKNGMTSEYKNRRLIKGELLQNIKLNVSVDPAVARETNRFLKTYIRTDMSKREKVEALYDGIASEMPYCYEMTEEIISKSKTGPKYKTNPLVDALVDKRAVCEGHANTMKWLLDQLGIDNYLAHGYAENGIGHVWNMIQTDKGYYGVDIGYKATIDKKSKRPFFELSHNLTNRISDKGLFFLEGFMEERGMMHISHDLKVRNDGIDQTIWKPYNHYFETHPNLERKLVKITGQIQLPQEISGETESNLKLMFTSLESIEQIEETFSSVAILNKSIKDNSVTFEAMVPFTRNGYKFIALSNMKINTYASSGIIELSEIGAPLNIKLQSLKKQAVVVKRPKWMPEGQPCTINLYAKILPSEKLVSLNDSRGGVTVKLEPHQNEGYATLDAIESDQFLYLVAEYVSDSEKRRYYYSGEGNWSLESSQMKCFDLISGMVPGVIEIVLDELN